MQESESAISNLFKVARLDFLGLIPPNFEHYKTMLVNNEDAHL